MAYEQKNLEGSLFRNDEKREGKQDPDYKGSATVDGTSYWLSAWLNTSKKDGTKYMQIRFKEKEAKASAPEPEKKVHKDLNDDLSDVPF